MGRTAGSDSCSTFYRTIFEHDSILTVGHTEAVTKAHSTSSTTELGAQAKAGSVYWKNIANRFTHSLAILGQFVWKNYGNNRLQNSGELFCFDLD